MIYTGFLFSHLASAAIVIAWLTLKEERSQKIGDFPVLATCQSGTSAMLSSKVNGPIAHGSTQYDWLAHGSLWLILSRHFERGWCKTWALDSGLNYGLDIDVKIFHLTQAKNVGFSGINKYAGLKCWYGLIFGLILLTRYGQTSIHTNIHTSMHDYAVHVKAFGN